MKADERGERKPGLLDKVFVRGAGRKCCPFSCLLQERLRWRHDATINRCARPQTEVDEAEFFSRVLPTLQTGDLVLFSDPAHLTAKAVGRSRVTHVAMCYANSSGEGDEEGGKVDSSGETSRGTSAGTGTDTGTCGRTQSQRPFLCDTHGGGHPAGAPPYRSEAFARGEYRPQHGCRLLLVEATPGPAAAQTRGGCEERRSAMLDVVDAEMRLKLFLHRISPPCEVLGDGRPAEQWSTCTAGHKSWLARLRSRARWRRRRGWERRRSISVRRLRLPQEGYAGGGWEAADAAAAACGLSSTVLTPTPEHVGGDTDDESENDANSLHGAPLPMLSLPQHEAVARLVAAANNADTGTSLPFDPPLPGREVLEKMLDSDKAESTRLENAVSSMQSSKTDTAGNGLNRRFQGNTKLQGNTEDGEGIDTRTSFSSYHFSDTDLARASVRAESEEESSADSAKEAHLETTGTTAQEKEELEWKAFEKLLEVDEREFDARHKALSSGEALAATRQRLSRRDGIFWWMCCLCRDGACCARSHTHIDYTRRQNALRRERRARAEQRKRQRRELQNRWKTRRQMGREKQHMMMQEQRSKWSRRLHGCWFSIRTGRCSCAFIHPCGRCQDKICKRNDTPPGAKSSRIGSWIRRLMCCVPASKRVWPKAGQDNHCEQKPTHAPWSVLRAEAAAAEALALTRRGEAIAALYQAMGLMPSPAAFGYGSGALAEHSVGSTAAGSFPLPGMAARFYVPSDFEWPQFRDASPVGARWPPPPATQLSAASHVPGAAGRNFLARLKRTLWRSRRAQRERKAMLQPPARLEGGVTLDKEIVVYGAEPSAVTLPTHPCWFEEELDQWYRYSTFSNQQHFMALKALRRRHISVREARQLKAKTGHMTGVGDNEWDAALAAAEWRDEAEHLYLRPATGADAAKAAAKAAAAVARGGYLPVRRAAFRPTDRQPLQPVQPTLSAAIGAVSATRIAPAAGTRLILPAALVPKPHKQHRQHSRCKRQRHHRALDAGLRTRVSARSTAAWISSGIFAVDPRLRFTPTGELLPSSNLAQEVKRVGTSAVEHVDAAFTAAYELEERYNTAGQRRQDKIQAANRRQRMQSEGHTASDEGKDKASSTTVTAESNEAGQLKYGGTAEHKNGGEAGSLAVYTGKEAEQAMKLAEEHGQQKLKDLKKRNMRKVGLDRGVIDAKFDRVYKTELRAVQRKPLKNGMREGGLIGALKEEEFGGELRGSQTFQKTVRAVRQQQFEDRLRKEYELALRSAPVPSRAISTAAQLRAAECKRIEYEQSLSLTRPPPKCVDVTGVQKVEPPSIESSFTLALNSQEQLQHRRQRTRTTTLQDARARRKRHWRKLKEQQKYSKENPYDVNCARPTDAMVRSAAKAAKAKPPVNAAGFCRPVHKPQQQDICDTTVPADALKKMPTLFEQAYVKDAPDELSFV